MDFFDRQDKARRKTKLLVFYFILAVMLLVVAVYAAVFLVFRGVGSEDSGAEVAFTLWEPDLFLGTTLGTLLVILIGSVSKTLQLSRGGSAVAEMLEGRLLNSNTIEADERKLLNVTEEMAIASGVPVPQVYVMDNEEAINAFAAGYSTDDAAVSVTSGCMKLLSRDELQGVIAHEFSHILNGDMRLNLRLMGLIFGILCLTVVGRILIRTTGRKNPLPLLGIALLIIGWIGVLFGRLIQAAVSRQREYLADASAVQFTRNPGGLSGALKKIGGLSFGSRLHSAHAEEASHLFFANGMRASVVGLMATHPPLDDRIRALDPSFDGKFPQVTSETSEAAMAPAAEHPQRPPISFPGFPPPDAGGAGIAPVVIAAEAILPDIGRPTTEHLRYAANLHETIPASLQAATRDPFGAITLVYALLLSHDDIAREKQIGELVRLTSDAVRGDTLRLWPEITNVPVQMKIPLVDLALPALRRLSATQFHQFRDAMQTLVASDNQFDLFEFVLQKIVLRHLESYFLPDRRTVAQFYDLRPLTNDCGILLSAMAYAGQEDATQAQAAFSRGSLLLSRIAKSEIPFMPKADCDLLRLDAALERLALALPQIKKNVLNASTQTIAADNIIQLREAELLRAIADALNCPMPPFIQPQQIA